LYTLVYLSSNVASMCLDTAKYQHVFQLSDSYQKRKITTEL